MTDLDLEDELDRASLKGIVAFALLTGLRQRGLRIVTVTVEPEEVVEANRLLAHMAPALLDRALLRNEGLPPCCRPDVKKILRSIRVVTGR